MRPVEAMRAKADEISSHARGERLPTAPGDDEIARLGATLNAMLARLEASFERERSFVADAGHELRTPLAILKSELELALRDGRSREDLVDALRSAAEETDRLTELAEALLVIARSDGGKLPLATTELQAADLLAGVGARFGDARCAPAVARSSSTRPQSLTLSADGRRLEQALDNLVDNALRHGARHDPRQRARSRRAASSCMSATTGRASRRTSSATPSSASRAPTRRARAAAAGWACRSSA